MSIFFKYFLYISNVLLKGTLFKNIYDGDWRMWEKCVEKINNQVIVVNVSLDCINISNVNIFPRYFNVLMHTYKYFKCIVFVVRNL